MVVVVEGDIVVDIVGDIVGNVVEEEGGSSDIHDIAVDAEEGTGGREIVEEIAGRDYVGFEDIVRTVVELQQDKVDSWTGGTED